MVIYLSIFINIIFIRGSRFFSHQLITWNIIMNNIEMFFKSLNRPLGRGHRTIISKKKFRFPQTTSVG